MSIQVLFLSLLLIYAGEFGVEGRRCRHHHNHHRNHSEHVHKGCGIEKLFVFGDSYADTGNLPHMFKKQPYGISKPGKPNGRYSDGHILTDFVAEELELKSPVPYRLREHKKSLLHYGMNFAFGGAGVFKTLYPRPNISTQVDYFEQVLKESVYTKSDMENAMALVTLSGNDYVAFEARGGTMDEIFQFFPKVVKELTRNLERISKLGVKRIAVASVPPLGCVPELTQESKYKECNGTGNLGAMQHDYILIDALKVMNNQSSTLYGYIDLYDKMYDIIDNAGYPAENWKLSTPILKPCCEGITAEYSCGDVDKNGKKMYTVCEHPESTFFWDDVHPTQAGWHAIVEELKPKFLEISKFNFN